MLQFQTGITCLRTADSIKQAAALVAEDLMTFYKGDEPGEIPGVLPLDDDYYFYTGGALWGALLSYRSRTGNTSYDDIISNGMEHQVGAKDDFMPANWSASLANDDQDIWALTSVLAATTDLEETQSNVTWLQMAQNVFDEQSNRPLDDGNCKGLLRWQIFPTNTGYNYVQTFANAAYFSLGAQIAVLQKNHTAATEASLVYQNLTDTGLIDDRTYRVYDGVELPGCTDVNKLQLTYASGVVLQGYAYMYNYTDGDSMWRERIDGLLDHMEEIFFPDGVATEVACSEGNCPLDFHFFKGMMFRYMADAMTVAPYTADRIMPLLKSSAKAAVAQCTSGDNGRMCGFDWTAEKSDGIVDAGTQMSVLDALVSILPAGAKLSASDLNSTDSGNGGGNGSNTDESTDEDSDPPSSGTRAGVSFAAVVTAAVLGVMYLV
ncbi:glycoside hydrolase family 76 protein [Xylariomycetidae sp. FL0641]|nr:glycoside hydrolase family 76 protein [Xylariomycetidae sp. FL0641]